MTGALLRHTSAPERRRLETRDVLVGVVLLALAVVVPLLRQQGLRSWETLWAEDGSVFYQQAADHGGLHVLFREFQGYLELTPRLLSVPAPSLPVADLALYFAVVGSIVGALLAWFTFYATRTWVSSVWVRLALAFLVVLMPAAGFENTASTTNTIWMLVAVAPWAIVSLDERRRDVAIRALVVFLAATATAVAFVFAPLVLAWIWVRRSRAATVVGAAYGVGALLQGLVMLTAGSNLTVVPPQRPLGPMVNLVGVRSTTLYLVGPDGAGRLWHDHGRPGWILAGLVLVGLFGVACWRAPRRAQALGIVLFAYGVGTFALLVWSRGTPPFADAKGVVDVVVNLRYSVPSTLMTAGAFAVVLAPIGPARERVVARIGRPLFIAHIVLVTVFSFTVTSFRGEGRPWSVRVADAEATCRAAPPGSTVDIGMDRLRLTHITVPCDELTG